MNETEINIVRKINNTRDNPKLIAQEIDKKLRNSYNGSQLAAFDKRIQTFEGISALNDMVLFLKTSKPSSNLILSKALSKAANSIAKQKGRWGRCQNQKPKTIYDIIKIYGDVQGKIGQLINLGGRNAEEVSTYFLLDDGLASRKRRRMLLDQKYQYIGVGTAPHSINGVITVILLAEKVQEKNQNQINVKYQQSQVFEMNKISDEY